MDWLDEARIKLKKNNRVLFAKDSEFLQDLSLLFRDQSHKTMVLWALDLAAESVAKLAEKYPDELRPGEALEAARAWAAGRIKMPLAQRKILDCTHLRKSWTAKRTLPSAIPLGRPAPLYTRQDTP